eukprot:356375-Chlamydomonas_euryale.AAC.3
MASAQLWQSLGLDAHGDVECLPAAPVVLQGTGSCEGDICGRGSTVAPPKDLPRAQLLRERPPATCISPIQACERLDADSVSCIAAIMGVARPEGRLRLLLVAPRCYVQARASAKLQAAGRIQCWVGRFAGIKPLLLTACGNHTVGCSMAVVRNRGMSVPVARICSCLALSLNRGTTGALLLLRSSPLRSLRSNARSGRMPARSVPCSRQRACWDLPRVLGGKSRGACGAGEGANLEAASPLAALSPATGLH